MPLPFLLPTHSLVALSLPHLPTPFPFASPDHQHLPPVSPFHFSYLHQQHPPAPIMERSSGHRDRALALNCLTPGTGPEASPLQACFQVIRCFCDWLEFARARGGYHIGDNDVEFSGNRGQRKLPRRLKWRLERASVGGAISTSSASGRRSGPAARGRKWAPTHEDG